MADACDTFREFAVAGVTANRERIAELVSGSLMLVTALLLLGVRAADDAEHDLGGVGSPQLPCDERCATPRKAHPVDHRPSLDQSEDPRLGIARLRLRRHGPDLDMAKPEGIQEVDIYKLTLDGSGRSQRITRFADDPGVSDSAGASNELTFDYAQFTLATSRT